MKKGFLAGGSSPRKSSAALAVAAVAGGVRARNVDNVLHAPLVQHRLDAGARPIRVEADFVTCSQ